MGSISSQVEHISKFMRMPSKRSHPIPSSNFVGTKDKSLLHGNLDVKKERNQKAVVEAMQLVVYLDIEKKKGSLTEDI